MRPSRSMASRYEPSAASPSLNSARERASIPTAQSASPTSVRGRRAAPAPRGTTRVLAPDGRLDQLGQRPGGDERARAARRSPARPPPARPRTGRGRCGGWRSSTRAIWMPSPSPPATASPMAASTSAEASAVRPWNAARQHRAVRRHPGARRLLERLVLGAQRRRGLEVTAPGGDHPLAVEGDRQRSERAGAARELDLTGARRGPALEVPQREAAADEASTPHWSHWSTVALVGANALDRPPERGAAAARPSVISAARPSSSRSAGPSGSAPGRGPRRPRHREQAAAGAGRGGRRRARRPTRRDRSRAPGSTSSGSSRLAALSSSRRGLADPLAPSAICPRSSSTRAPLELVERPGLGRRPAAPSAASNAPACEVGAGPQPAPAPSRRSGSGVSATERSRNAAAAASPPRAWARPAERSSSAATSSSGPDAAAARCQARRSGSSCGSVAAASAMCTARRSGAGGPVDRRSAPADAGSARWRRSRAAARSSPAPAASVSIPSVSAARQSSVASPTGSAAASSMSRCVASGSAREPPHVVLLDLAGKVAGVREREAAGELGGGHAPRQLQQRQRVPTRLGDDPVADAVVEAARDDRSPRRARASSSAQAPERAARGGRPAGRSSAGSRTAKTIATTRPAAVGRRSRGPGPTRRRAIARRRRGTAAAAPRRPRASRLSTARRDEEAVGGVAGRQAEGDAQGVLLRLGQRVELASIGAQSWCSPANGSSISDSTPAICATRKPDACRAQWRRSAVLPTPGLTTDDEDRALAADGHRSSSRSSTRRSGARPRNAGGR